MRDRKCTLPKEPTAKSTDLSGDLATILVVNGDTSILASVQRILRAANYRVLVAENCVVAAELANLEHVRIDAALLDVQAQGLPVTELADRILSVQTKARILLMSGFVDDYDIVHIKLLDQYGWFGPERFRSDGLIKPLQDALQAPSGSSGTAMAAGNRICE